MLKKLFLSAALLLCCSDCKAQEHQNMHYSLVVTLDPGESVMIKTSDGESNFFIDYTEKKNVCAIPDSFSRECPRAYHIDFHVVFWVECPACRTYYNAADGGCKNQYCPSNML